MTARAVKRLSLPIDIESASDEELVAACKEGISPARDALLDRFRTFARSRAQPYLFAAVDRDGVVQEAMISILQAIREFDPKEQDSFRTFADVCITERLVNYARTATPRPAPLRSSSA